METVERIETLTLRDYISKKLMEHKEKALAQLGGSTSEETMLNALCENARCIALQEIAYRLEYGFITEIGDKSLKNLLPQE